MNKIVNILLETEYRNMTPKEFKQLAAGTPDWAKLVYRFARKYSNVTGKPLWGTGLNFDGDTVYFIASLAGVQDGRRLVWVEVTLKPDGNVDFIVNTDNTKCMPAVDAFQKAFLDYIKVPVAPQPYDPFDL